MSQTTPDPFAQLVETCAQNADALAAALGEAFGSAFTAEPGESGPFAADTLPDSLNGPGVMLVLPVGGQAVIGLLPAMLPLPEWCRDPSSESQSRLQQLAAECAHSVLPAGVESQSCTAFFTDNLQSALMALGPTGAAQSLIMHLAVKPQDESSATDEAAPPRGLLCLVWPVDNAPLPLGPAVNDAMHADDSSPGFAEPPEQQPAVAPRSIHQLSGPAAERLRRLRHLPVSVIVRLAEKKIEMGQLLALSPGAMITFNKSCEDLLDLYVNNHLYCRGEAVKIGEKFGLKVNQVGVVPVRNRTVLNS